jgi:ABC-type nitrate/sulfonate/bicarbonate transport system substrate-binding protein
MTMITWLRRAAAAVLALAALMPVRGNAQAVEQPKLTLSIGTFIISYLPLPVADAKGFFKQQASTSRSRISAPAARRRCNR